MLITVEPEFWNWIRGFRSLGFKSTRNRAIRQGFANYKRLRNTDLEQASANGGPGPIFGREFIQFGQISPTPVAGMRNEKVHAGTIATISLLETAWTSSTFLQI